MATDQYTVVASILSKERTIEAQNRTLGRSVGRVQARLKTTEIQLVKGVNERNDYVSYLQQKYPSWSCDIAQLQLQRSYVAPQPPIQLQNDLHPPPDRTSQLGGLREELGQLRQSVEQLTTLLGTRGQVVVTAASYITPTANTHVIPDGTSNQTAVTHNYGRAEPVFTVDSQSTLNPSIGANIEGGISGSQLSFTQQVDNIPDQPNNLQQFQQQHAPKPRFDFTGSGDKVAPNGATSDNIMQDQPASIAPAQVDDQKIYDAFNVKHKTAEPAVPEALTINEKPLPSGKLQEPALHFGDTDSEVSTTSSISMGAAKNNITGPTKTGIRESTYANMMSIVHRQSSDDISEDSSDTFDHLIAAATAKEPTSSGSKLAKAAPVAKKCSSKNFEATSVLSKAKLSDSDGGVKPQKSPPNTQIDNKSQSSTASSDENTLDSEGSITPKASPRSPTEGPKVVAVAAPTKVITAKPPTTVVVGAATKDGPPKSRYGGGPAASTISNQLGDNSKTTEMQHETDSDSDFFS